jgi:hypothetical protein
MGLSSSYINTDMQKRKMWSQLTTVTILQMPLHKRSQLTTNSVGQNPLLIQGVIRILLIL